jgi:hypothetical protein
MPPPPSSRAWSTPMPRPLRNQMSDRSAPMSEPSSSAPSSPACGGGVGRGRLPRAPTSRSDEEQLRVIPKIAAAIGTSKSPLPNPYWVDISSCGTATPLPAWGERSDRQRVRPLAGPMTGSAIRVRGPFRESERVDRPPHPDPLPASGARGKRRLAICRGPTEMCPPRSLPSWHGRQNLRASKGSHG